MKGLTVRWIKPCGFRPADYRRGSSPPVWTSGTASPDDMKRIRLAAGRPTPVMRQHHVTGARVFVDRAGAARR